MRIFHCTAVYTPGSFLIRCIILTIFAGSQAIDIFCFFIPLYKSDSKILFYTISSIWSLLTLLWIWSYIITCWMDAGSVEQALYKLGYVDKNGQFFSNIELPIEIQKMPLCEKCQLPKPHRTHHCSQCNKCYFRFDHHCDVVGNCVAYSNIKSFMLFLFYSSILLFLSVVVAILAYTKTKKVQLSILIMACLLGFFLGAVIFVFACFFIPEVCINNRTTLERIAGDEPKRYIDGVSENVRQIFGRCPLVWILPTRPIVDGFTWSAIYKNSDVNENNVNSVGDGKTADNDLLKNEDENENLNNQEVFKDEIDNNRNVSLTDPLNPN